MKRTVPKTIGPGAKILECRAQNGCRVNAPYTVLLTGTHEYDLIFFLPVAVFV